MSLCMLQLQVFVNNNILPHKTAIVAIMLVKSICFGLLPCVNYVSVSNSRTLIINYADYASSLLCVHN